jgi:flavin reductase (DIM6/NTAB) family NADH-FMN oxidoreductase RutF
MSIDKGIAKGLQIMTNGVYVVAASAENQTHGCTVTWVSQASYRNPLLTVALDKNHDTFKLIERSGNLVINVLKSSQKDVAEHFGHDRRSSTVQHFQEQGGQQQPVLKDCLAAIFAKVVGQVDARDHVVLLVEATETRVLGEGEPLVYSFAGGYGAPKAG